MPATMLRSHHKTIFEALGRNPIHPFPARMAPGIALDALGNGREPLGGLDPMSGSGTGRAVARANGLGAFGIALVSLAFPLKGCCTLIVKPEGAAEQARAC